MRGLPRERERGRVGEDESFRVRSVYHGSKDYGKERSKFEGFRYKHGHQRNNWDKFSASFFFCNFPQSVEAADLWRTFERLGRVVDVYISSKLTRKGSRFGFVRYKLDHGADKIEESLNNIWFGSYKLRANKSRFSMKVNDQVPAKTRKVYKEKRASGLNNEIVEGRLFSEVVANNFKAPSMRSKGKSNIPKEAGPKITKSLEPLPSLNLKPSKKGWLANCLVGDLKNNTSGKSIGMIMEKENFAVGPIRSIGGNKILIDCLSSENRDIVFSKFEWWNIWFKWLVPWNNDFSTVGRVAKVRCYGVPLQSWCKENFFDIASTWGEVLEIDDATLDKSNLDYGMFTILTKTWDPISHDLLVSVDNESFTIKVLELPLACNSKHERDDYDNSSDVISSSDDYFSDSDEEDFLKGDESVFSGEDLDLSGKEDDKSEEGVQETLIGSSDRVNLEASSNRQKTADRVQKSGNNFIHANDDAAGNYSYPTEVPVQSGEKAHANGADPFMAHKESSRVGSSDGVSSIKAQLHNRPNEISIVPDSESTAHSNNQFLVNVPGEIMDKIESLSFTVNGIKERGFKSLAEILSNLDSNNLDISFANKSGKGKKPRGKQRRKLKARANTQGKRVSQQSDKPGFERISLNSEEEKRELNRLGEELGIDLQNSNTKGLASNAAC